MPRFAKVKEDDEIIVNCETWESRRSIRVQIRVHEIADGFSWVGQSKPGESGSGIWKKSKVEDAEDVLELVGLAGRWAGNELGRTEISVRPAMDQSDVQIKIGLTRICLHPGAGKTRRIVPAMVDEFLHGSRSSKIVLVGPTRVVAKELYQAIYRKYPGRVGLSIKGDNQCRNATAGVQITTHATFVNMIHEAAREVLNVGLLIVDEAHEYPL